MFAKQHNEEGLYLVRESRTKDCTFILSLCQKEGVFNYRISKDCDHRFALVDTTGVSPVPRSVNSCHTLNDLILHHHHFPVSLFNGYTCWCFVKVVLSIETVNKIIIELIMQISLKLQCKLCHMVGEFSVKIN